jgi:hypothetical protein
MKLYIIPGYEEGEQDYSWLISRASGTYEVIFLNLQMKEGASFKELISTEVDSDSTVFGFSCGGIIAFKLTTRVKKGIYCSIANVLGDDRDGGEDEMHELFGKTLTDELLATSYGTPAAENFVIMHGDQEFFPRSEMMRKQFGMKVIPNTDHEFTDAYKQAVFEELGLEATIPQGAQKLVKELKGEGI